MTPTLRNDTHTHLAKVPVYPSPLVATPKAAETKAEKNVSSKKRNRGEIVQQGDVDMSQKYPLRDQLHDWSEIMEKESNKGFGGLQFAEMQTQISPPALASANALDVSEVPAAKQRKRPPPKISFLDTASAEEVELERLFATKT